MGASSQLVCGVWMGYDRPQPLGYGSAGGKWCGPVFREFMRQALPIWQARRPMEKLVEDARATSRQKFLAQQFKQYIRVRICDESGQLATRECPATHFDTFSAAGGAPTELCQIHRRNPTAPRDLGTGAEAAQPGDLGYDPSRDNASDNGGDDGAPNANPAAPGDPYGDGDENGNSVPAYQGDGIVPLDENSTRGRARDDGGASIDGQVLDEGGIPQTLDELDADPPARRGN